MDEDSVRPTLVDKLDPPERSGSGGACVVIIYGEAIGRRIALGGKDFAMGRTKECDLLLDDETVSRAHAELEYLPPDPKGGGSGRYLARDLGSTNGTYVNGTRVREQVLGDGDFLKVGRTICKYLQGGNVEAEFHKVIFNLMTHDGLTQAHNRRHFDDELKRELSRAARYGRPLSLLMLDVDHFKVINDTHGHLTGDEVLRQLADLVHADIRREDLFARIGGEEFAILMPETRITGARQIAERLRTTIERAELVVDDTTISVTCSFGVAELAEVERGMPTAALFEPCDNRLYEAKARGRNMVVSGEVEPTTGDD